MSQIVDFDSLPKAAKVQLFADLADRMGSAHEAAKYIRELRKKAAHVQPVEDPLVYQEGDDGLCVEELDSIEAAARAIEQRGFEGSDEIARALRGVYGDKAPRDAKEGAQTLIAALRDHRVPQHLKDNGSIRDMIAKSWACHNDYTAWKKTQMELGKSAALEAFRTFRTDLQKAGGMLSGYVTEQMIRRAAAPFFVKYEGGLPSLLWHLENHIAKDSDVITQLLVEDREIAEEVGNAKQGTKAYALVVALQNKARARVAENDRRRNGGKFGRSDGQAASSHEDNDRKRRDNRSKRTGPTKAGGRSWSKPNPGGKK